MSSSRQASTLRLVTLCWLVDRACADCSLVTQTEFLSRVIAFGGGSNGRVGVTTAAPHSHAHAEGREPAELHPDLGEGRVGRALAVDRQVEACTTPGVARILRDRLGGVRGEEADALEYAAPWGHEPRPHERRLRCPRTAISAYPDLSAAGLEEPAKRAYAAEDALRDRHAEGGQGQRQVQQAEGRTRPVQTRQQPSSGSSFSIRRPAPKLYDLAASMRQSKRRGRSAG